PDRRRGSRLFRSAFSASNDRPTALAASGVARSVEFATGQLAYSGHRRFASPPIQLETALQERGRDPSAKPFVRRRASCPFPPSALPGKESYYQRSQSRDWSIFL